MKQLAPLALSVLLLSACGGGGGGSDGGTGSTGPTPDLTDVQTVSAALVSGDAQDIRGADALYPILLDQIGTQLNNQAQVVDQTLSSGISYTPPLSSQRFVLHDLDTSFPLIEGSKEGTTLAIAGQLAQGRFAAYGANVLRLLQEGSSDALSAPVNGTLAWLLKITPAQLSTPHHVALSFLGSDETKTRQWLQDHFPTWTIDRCNEVATLATCLAPAELTLAYDTVATADQGAALTALTTTLKQGKPLLYLHNRWSSSAFADQLMAKLGVEMPYSGNYFQGDRAQWADADAMLAREGELHRLRRLIRHLQARDFSFDWSQCMTYVGKTSCEDIPGLRAEFLDAATYLRDALNQLDTTGQALFASDHRKLLKTFVLLGDKLRQDIRYPMDKVNTDSNRFLAAYLADHLTYYHRDVNPRQTDLGNFSAALADDLATNTVDLDLPLGPEAKRRGTGIYALPGRTLTVECLDGNTAELSFFLNTQRSSSSRVWDPNKYQRPRYLRSPDMALAAGQRTAITSPYGGPLLLNLPSGSGTMKLRIRGAARYAYLDGITNPTDISAFKTTLAASPFGWAGIRTNFVEINARTEMLRETIASAPYNGDLSAALGAIWTYMIKGTYELAGFNGSELAMANAITTRCTQLAWNCSDPVVHAKPAIQHINIDLSAACGDGCSGNPYDQDWSLDPMGWGESHEIGHNLQRGRLKIYDGRSGEVSNNIFPSYKGWQYYQNTGIKLGHCTSGAHTALYAWLQDAYKSGDPKQTLYNRLWSQTGTYDNAGERLGFYLQLAFAANATPGLDNGWQIFTLMYLHERLFTDAIKNDSSWSSNKDKLGFGTYTSRPSNISGNDFMLISYSLLSGKDQRPFFDLWGVSYSAEASQQVASYTLPAAAKVYYATDNHCVSLNAPALPVDGSTVW